MFSMRYTSPKVTPKRDVPSSLDVAIHQQHGERAQDNNTGDHGANSNSLLNDNVVPTQTTLLQPKLDNEEDVAEEASSSKNNLLQVSPTLTKDNIISSNGNQNEYSTSVNNNSSMSEIDSAVVNISDDIEPRPRSNLLALLDREYNNANSNHAGNTPGEKQEQYGAKDKADVIKIDDESSKDNIAADENIDADKTSAIDKNCIEEKGNHTKVASDDRVIEDDVDFDSDFSLDQKNTIYMKSIKSTSNNNLHENNRFSVQQQVRESSSFGYIRSSSMEPMGLVGRSRSVEEGVLDQQTTSSVEGVVDDVDDDDDDVQPEGTSTKQQSSSPIVYDMSKEDPASPILSAINGGDESIHIGSPASAANTTSEIGGDTYFESKTPTTDPAKPGLEEMKQGGESFDDDLVHVTLPPRVNRTTLTGYSNSGSNAPFLSSPARDPMLPSHPLSPRQAFTHTHSLLDDCSDEEEEMTSFTIEDSPTRHVQQSSYSCLPRARNSGEGSPFSYFKKQQKQNKNVRQSTSSMSTGSSATLVASNNIQQALLKTRHRRWECQMEFAGPHAQSKEVFDLSNRVHYIVGYSPENNYTERGQVARLSVSVEAIRAAALASGLWRTVRLVKLPKGLFFSNFDQMLEYDSVEEEEIWALLKMLNSTFPMLDQLDFGGDISRGPSNRNSDNADDVANNTCDNDEWRNEIISCIMECLPNLLAIDGFVVEQEVHRTESHGEYVVPIGSEDVESSLDNDASANHSQNNLQEPTEKNLIGIKVGKDSDAVDTLGDTTTSPSQNSTLESSHSNGSSMDVVETKKVSPGTLSTSSSLLSSSKSWGSNSSGSRPPTCPASATKPRPRLPTKPVDRKKSLMKAGSGLKRRVMGLIPSVSMMDNDEEEEEGDDSEDSENEAETDCPRDLL